MEERQRYHDDYSTCRKTFATLRVYCGNIEPDEISSKLDLIPQRIQRKGDKGESFPEEIQLNGWFLSSEESIASKDSRRHIDWILEQIMGSAEVIADLLDSGSRIDICVFWESKDGHGGPILSPAQSKKLAHLNIEIGFDIFFD